MTVRYTERAIRQIAEIIETIAIDDPGTASAFSRRFERLASLIARHPMIGRQTDLEGVRMMSTRPYPYLIFYRPAAGNAGITILRVRHMARRDDWRTGR